MFGGNILNNTLEHTILENVSFGGVGLSGMGSYHGKKSFKVFSHKKSILKKSASKKVNLKYHPI